MKNRQSPRWLTRSMAFPFAVAVIFALCDASFAQLPPPPPPPLPIPPPDLTIVPPELPSIPSLPQVLPPDAPTASGSAQLPVASATLDSKVLVISADGNEPVLGAIRQALEYEGVPYTLYVARQMPGGFTPSRLSDGNLHGYYQGIVLTTGALAYFDGTNWSSGFTSAEWQTLWDYEAKYRVRSIIAYAYPTADLGYGPATGMDATTNPISARFSTTGQPIFSYVNSANPLTITRAWVYLAAAAGTGNNVLLTDPQNHALSLIRTYPDGRQVLSLTFDGNFFLIHSLALGHGLVSWVMGGLFLGERHIYMAPQVDDIFIDNDLYGSGIYRITGLDWSAVTGWQAQKQSQTQTADLHLHMAFNGEGTTGEYALDTLTPAARLTQSQFPWLNHTYDHENLDAVSYAFALQEFTRNNQIADSMGFANYDRRAAVTPDVSGLANPAAMRAAFDAGIRFIVTDTSRPGMDNPTPQAGIYNQYQPAILMVPRRPTNLYYNVTTPTEWTNEYNYIYHSYWGRDLTYSEILDKESDMLLQYMLRGEIDPWMFHQSNLRAYDNTHTLLGDLIDRALDKYGRLFVLPIRSLAHAAIGDWMQRRMQYNGAGISASISPTLGTITISAARAAVVPVTGLCMSGSESYGGQCISHITLAAGQTVTYQAGPAPPPPTDPPLAVDPIDIRHSAISARPNPFTPATSLTFSTTRPGRVTARIYDLSGRLVRTLVDGMLEGGQHTLRWNAAAEGGQRVASGIYFVRLTSPDGSDMKRLVVMN